MTLFLNEILTFLDVKGINHVINFDLPTNIEDYIHRIGRTGRGGAVGTAISFFTENNSKLANDLCRIMREAKQTVPQDLSSFEKRSYHGHSKYDRYNDNYRYRRNDNYGFKNNNYSFKSSSNNQPLKNPRF